MIDSDGYRKNVGIAIINKNKNIFCARRVGGSFWQMPQGGIEQTESPTEAMYRELEEETGLFPDSVEIIAKSKNWYKYKLPVEYRRKLGKPQFIGQKQKWFLLRFFGQDDLINLHGDAEPEFDKWRWSPYWSLIDTVISFKKSTYNLVLKEFADSVGV
tara:strand:- start:733 stop:1206 length:474 start_codon:yes stop_codon:yes gene_type:complete